MDYIQGGELTQLVRNKDGSPKALGGDAVRFYSACIVEAMRYLRTKRILFRDLKLANIMCDNSGYLKITDFGLAKELRTDRT